MIKNRIALLFSYYNALKRLYIAYFKKPVEIWPYSACSCNLNDLEILSLKRYIKEMEENLYLSHSLIYSLNQRAFLLASIKNAQ